MRVSYFITIAVCLAGSVFFGIELFVSLLEPSSIFDASGRHFYTAVGIGLFILPCCKALFRLLRGGALLPRAQESNTRAYLILITLIGICGHVFAALTAAIYIDVRLNNHSDVSGVGALIAAAAVLYLLTLWIGELVVVTSRAPADSTQGPFNKF